MMRTHSKRLIAAVLLAGVLVSAAGTAQIAAQSSPGQPHAALWPPEPAPDGMLEPGPGWPPAVVDITRPLPGRPFKENFVEVDGWHIRYVEAGKGSTVIVSFPGSGGLEMSTAKDMLARDYRVIEINPPGWGPDELNTRERDMRDMAGVFVHALEKIGVKKFHLIGTSMGCMHAMWTAEQFPERIQSLTLEGGECFTRPEDRRPQTARAVAAQTKARNGGGWDNDYSIWAGWPAYQWSANKWWQTPAFQARLMYRRYVKNFPYNRNAHVAELVGNAKNIKIPTVDLVGDRDEIMKVSVAQAWRANMPAARFVIVAGATHDIQNSQPEQFVELIKACSLDPSPSKLMCPGD